MWFDAQPSLWTTVLKYNAQEDTIFNFSVIRVQISAELLACVFNWKLDICPWLFPSTSNGICLNPNSSLSKLVLPSLFWVGITFQVVTAPPTPWLPFCLPYPLESRWFCLLTISWIYLSLSPPTAWLELSSSVSYLHDHITLSPGLSASVCLFKPTFSIAVRVAHLKCKIDGMTCAWTLLWLPTANPSCLSKALLSHPVWLFSLTFSQPDCSAWSSWTHILLWPVPSALDALSSHLSLGSCLIF